MAETLVRGRSGQVFVGEEPTYGTTPTLNATDAVRHVTFQPTHSPKNRVNGTEKKQSPGTVVRLDRKETAALSLETMLRPSGTLNTLPELTKVLKAGFGQVSNVTLSTTVSASPTPTTTTATVASATGLVKGQAVLITVSAVKYVRFLTAVTGSALTWAPALPSAPATGAAVKGGITYSLTSELSLPLSAAHYLSSDTTHSKAVKGWVVDRLAMRFDANTEPMVTASGPAQTVVTPAPSKPVAFTTVGTQNPPSGLVGGLYVGSAAYKFSKLDVEIQNGLALRLSSYGAANAEGILPRGRRVVTMGLDALVGDESVIYDNAESGTPVAIMKQTGYTEGNIIAIYAPRVDFEVPSQDDGDDVPTWPFKGVCLESADGMNDELFLAIL